MTSPDSHLPPSSRGSAAALLLLTLAGIATLALSAWWLLSREPASLPGDPGRADPPASEVPAVAPTDPSQVPDSLPAAGRERNAIAEADAGTARQAALTGRATFFGQVRGLSGQPCPDAEIWYDGVLQTRTDATGQFEMKVIHAPISIDLNRPRYAPIAAWKEGEGSAVIEAPPRSQRVHLRLIAKEKAHGIVVDRAGQPVVGARVHGTCFPRMDAIPRRKAFEFETESAADGTFHFQGLPTGLYAFEAWRDPLASTGVRQVNVNEEPVEGIRIVLGEKVRLRGQFQPWPPDGARVAGVQIRTETGQEFTTPIDAAGRFEMLVPGAEMEDAALVLAAVPGYLFACSLPSSRGEPTVDLGSLLLDEPAFLEGRVEASTGLLGQGLQVKLATFVGSQLYEAQYPVQRDGTFRAGPVPPGLVAIGISFGVQLIERISVQEVSSGVTAVPPIRLGAQAFMGQVTDPTGTPIALRASVDLERWNEAAATWHTLLSTRVDESGRFFLHVNEELPREARLRLRCTTPGLQSQQREFLGSALEEVRYSEFRMPSGQSIQGTLRDRSGEPHRNWVVVAQDDDSGSFQVDFVADDGSFEITGLGDQSYRLLAQAPDRGLHALGFHRPSRQPLTLEVEGE